jgi:predicted nucleotidyltransferase component of viral defense system
MIPPDSPYWRQVRLLVGLLPIIADEECFALKGGTAINLFIRDLPRLSVDIDLAYLPINDYAESKREIDRALRRLREFLASTSPPYEVTVGENDRSGHIDTLNVRDRGVQVKIEVNPVVRGVVHRVQSLPVRPAVEDQVGFARTRVLAFEDLYAGKLVAALDRQHPRDLFDVKLLLENEGISDILFRTFLVYLIGHKASMTDTLNPNRKPLEDLFRTQFETMADADVSVADLKQTRERLIGEIHARLGDREKQLLLSVKRLKPDWEVLGFENVDQLPAVKWKLHYLRQMTEANRANAVARLEKLLKSTKR